MNALIDAVSAIRGAYRGELRRVCDVARDDLEYGARDLRLEHATRVAIEAVRSLTQEMVASPSFRREVYHQTLVTLASFATAVADVAASTAQLKAGEGS